MVVKLAKIDAPLDDIVITIDDEDWTIQVRANAGQTDLLIQK